MQTLGKDGGTHKARFVGIFAGALLLAAAHSAHAQAPAANNDNAPSEAARRAAASPYRFILQNASAPRKAAAPAPATAAAPVAEPKRPASPPVQQAAAQPQRTAPVEAAPAPAPAPEPAVASISRQPAAAPPPVRREIIAIKTDEPRLSPALLREQPKGTVKIHFDINYDGSVGEVKVVSSSNRALNKPTVEAVQGWKFQPVDEVLTVETELVYKFDE
ncbi:MAG TPA: TonB family protein [Ramlibacter sp.]|nr:TonB family protein [Ramlibacter sp.]